MCARPENWENEKKVERNEMKFNLTTLKFFINFHFATLTFPKIGGRPQRQKQTFQYKEDEGVRLREEIPELQRKF